MISTRTQPATANTRHLMASLILLRSASLTTSLMCQNEIDVRAHCAVVGVTCTQGAVSIVCMHNCVPKCTGNTPVRRRSCAICGSSSNSSSNCSRRHSSLTSSVCVAQGGSFQCNTDAPALLYPNPSTHAHTQTNPRIFTHIHVCKLTHV